TVSCALTAVLARLAPAMTHAQRALRGRPAGLAAPRPRRPPKLRLEVATLLFPGGTRSPLEAMHIEQPGSRHSKPASLNTLSSPSASASRLTLSEPGTTQAFTWDALWRPLAMAAAARRSELRLLVQEPMNPQSTLVR